MTTISGDLPSNGEIPAPGGSFADVDVALAQLFWTDPTRRTAIATALRALALQQWADRRLQAPAPIQEWRALADLIIEAARSPGRSPPQAEG